MLGAFGSSTRLRVHWFVTWPRTSISSGASFAAKPGVAGRRRSHPTSHDQGWQVTRGATLHRVCPAEPRVCPAPPHIEPLIRQ
jgi:hypothetical protein